MSLLIAKLLLTASPLILSIPTIEPLIYSTFLDKAYTFSYSDEIYPPFATTDSITLSGTITYTGNFEKMKCKQGISLYSPLFSSTTAYKTQMGKEFTIYKGYENNYSYQVPNVKSYIKDSISVVIGMYSSDEKRYVNPTKFTLYGKTYDEIDPSNYRSTPLVYSNTSKGNGDIINETFLFDNFRDYIDSEYYYKITLDDLSFQYSYVYDFTYTSAYLLINNSNVYFPYLSSVNNVVKIPLSLTEEEGIISFQLSGKLYVNPITLDMSFDDKDGYVQTSSFYLPKNKKSLFESLEMFLCVEGMGSNEISFKYPLGISSDSNIIGNCFDADYCVIGGVKK